MKDLFVIFFGVTLIIKRMGGELLLEGLVMFGDRMSLISFYILMIFR
jgi:hypothetical protein